MCTQAVQAQELTHSKAWRPVAGNVAAERSLVDFNCDFEIFAANAEAHAAHRRRANRIKSDRHPYIGFGGAKAVSGIKADPADIGNESFRPGVASLLLDAAVRHLQVAGDVARRNVETAGRSDKNVAVVAADAALERERFAGARHHLGHFDVERYFAVKLLEQSVRLRQGIALAAPAHPLREIADRFIRRGARGGAQEQ